MAEEKESIPIITHPGPTAEDMAKTATTTTASAVYVDNPKQGFIQSLITQIGMGFVQAVLALAVVGALVYKFLLSDIDVPIEVYIGMAGIIIGFYFGKEVSK